MKKVIDMTEHMPTMQKQRARRTNRKFLLLLTLFFVMIFLFLYMQSAWSKVRTVSLEGQVLLAEEQYMQHIDVQVGQSLWGFDKDEIEEQLRALQWVKEASVAREWPNDVTIKIEEWKKVAYIVEDTDFYPILENSYIFEQADTLQPVDAPIFLHFNDENLRKRVLRQLAQLKPEVSAAISQISAMPTDIDPYAIKLLMNDGYEVRAEISTLAEKLNHYPSIVATLQLQQGDEKGVIDIEVGSYYRSFLKEYNEEVWLQQESEEELNDSE